MGMIECGDAKGNMHLFKENEFVERPAVYGICFVADKVLLIKDKFSYKCGIPGGGIDNNETDLEALKREFVEETGIQISPKIQLLLNDNTYFLADGEKNPWKVRRAIYAVTQIGGILNEKWNPDEILEAKYTPIAKAIELSRMSKNNKAIAELLDRIDTMLVR
jgi:8-oxo-dGTP pyrophosphatase MutT (NUDIX family)